MNDRELVKKIINGDQNAFKQLFEEYQHMVFNISYRMSGSQEEAEDITQDVFIKIFHAVGKFRGDAKLSSWIYRIAVNTCLKRERRKKLENWISLDFLFQGKKQFQPIANEKSPHQKVEISETEQIVQQAINQLPARQKTALILHRYEYLSYKEIAQVMEISLSAVESLLHRAKDNLTKKLLPMKKYLR
ncbi:MAG: RNA polymerase sigma factor [Candidatus Krumholzibacteriales bacterium]